MILGNTYTVTKPGLTLTWDVLKFHLQAVCVHPAQINFNMGCFEICRDNQEWLLSLQINFNMGCFEIRVALVCRALKLWINFNMGCFEICLLHIVEAFHVGLTLTWDVLKCVVL